MDTLAAWNPATYIYLEGFFFLRNIPAVLKEVKAMEQGGTLVSISFRSLLEKICISLNLRQPMYTLPSADAGECCAIVRRTDNPHAFVCFGNAQGGFEESSEHAARKLVLFLAGEYNVCVDDVNLSLWEDSESVRSDFRLKREQLEHVERKEPPMPPNVQASAASALSLAPTVSVDFYLLLGEVVSKFQVLVTPVEYLQHGPADYKAYLSVSLPSTARLKWIRGERCNSMVSAKQSLAKRVILFLMPILGFEVEDVNFHAMKRTSVLLGLERESYLAVKERVYEVKEDLSAKPVVREEEELTPRGVEFAIPEPQLPKPPKKRPYPSSSRFFSDVVPQHLVAAALDGVIPRAKISKT